MVKTPEMKPIHVNNCPDCGYKIYVKELGKISNRAKKRVFSRMPTCQCPIAYRHPREWSSTFVEMEEAAA